MNRYFGHLVFGALLCLASPLLSAQNSATLTPNQAVADGRLTPVLSWTSSPAGATRCVASGGWSGDKPAAGSQTLPQITATASYALECHWPGGTTGSATVSWTAPRTNTDGSALTNLASYRVVAGRSAGTLAQTTNVDNPAATSVVIPNLEVGDWFFAVVAVNSNGAQSDLSNVAQKAIVGSPGPTARASTSITIRPVPSAPVVTTVVVGANYPFVPVFRVNEAGNAINSTFFGMVPVGRACGAKVSTWRGIPIHRVEVRIDEVWGTADTSNLAAPCGRA